MIEDSEPPEAVILLNREDDMLIVGDSLQNTAEPDDYVNFLMKLMMKKMGFFKAFKIGPAWLQFAKPNKTSARSLLDLNYEHVLPAHGEPVVGDAKAKYRPVIQGEWKGCHEA